MVVTYNGDTNALSGKGTPNPKLYIPNLNSLDPSTHSAILAIQQWCNNLTAPSSTIFSQTFSVSGTLVVPAGAVGYLPPFYMPVAAGQPISLVGLRCSVRAGSCTVDIEQNGTAIYSGLGITATPTDTSIISSVSNDDSFQPVITAVSGADGLSVSFYFTMTVTG
jgi:hypothetical protein